MLTLTSGPCARLGAVALGTLACLAQPALAQPSAADPQTVVVAATRRPLPQSSALADITVITREAIERSGASCAADLLATVPGIEYARNGGPAGTTSLYIRGAESRHTALFIDGVRVDGQATGGAPWELVPIDQIERVEVLRGAAAAVYGSDAVGGVVQMFTRRAADGRRASASLAYGSDATLQARAGFSQRVGELDYSLSAAHAGSDGFNARENGASNPDADGWRRGSVQAGLGWQLTPDHRLEAAFLGANLWSRYDGFSATADDQSWQTLRSGSLNWQGQWGANTDTRVQVAESRNTYESQPSFYRTETTLGHLLLQAGHTIGHHQFTALLERRVDELLNPATAFTAELSGQRHQDALALGWRASWGAHTLQANLRHDQDSEFGSQPTASLGWGWRMTPAWRLSANAATTFRAPTLYQRFSEYGVSALKPETGRNVELALHWAAGEATASATVWRNRVEDLIIFGAAGPCVSAYGCYENASRVRYQGLTLAGGLRALGAHWSAAVDWHDPRNLDTDTLLPRRARALGHLAMDTQWAGWGLGAELRGSGGRYDDNANTRRMGGYGVLAVRAERALAQGLTLQARIDNLTGKAYEVAQTYPTGGRRWTLALRWATE